MRHRPFAAYLHARQSYGASFAPDGQTIAFLTDVTGTPQVWTVSAQGGWPDQRTFGPERVAGARYAPRGDRLLYSMDTGGDERAQLYLIEDDGSRLTPLTAAPSTIHTFGGWSPDGEQIAYASNARDAAFFDVYVQRVDGPAPAERVFTHDGTSYAGEFSPDGRTLLISRSLTNMENQLLLLDLASGAVRELTQAASECRYVSARWAADSRSIFALCDAGRDTLGLARIDEASGAVTWLLAGDWEYGALEISPDGQLLALVEHRDGYGVLHVLDAYSLQALPVPGLPELTLGVILDLDWSPTGNQLALTIAAGSANADIYVLDLDESALRQVTRSARGGISRASLVVPELIHYPSFDGRQIPAFYYRPAGQVRGLPVVVYVHGGPEGQFVPSFSAVVQYLVHRGYAVLGPNVRGSTGYGKAYTHMDDVRLRMDSVADLRAAVDWLRAHGGADPARIAVMGGSYGGFMTLAAITTYPELWAAAVDIVGIANFVTFLEQTGPWRRKLREPEYGSLERDRDFLEAISPIHHLDRIVAPLLVIHGANDPRVPVGEAEQIVAGLRARERPVEYLRFEDEGHGIVRLPNRIRAYTEVARFLDRYLMGERSS